MPLIIPDRLPAAGALKEENIFTMNMARAQNQDIRPLKIIVLNLMPTKIATEIQLARVLANSPLQVEMNLLAMDLPQVSQLPHTDAFDALYDLHFMVASNMNLPHQIRYWQSAYSELLDVAMKPVFFPSCTTPESYGAMASLIGAIGSTTLEKGELAYRLMRTMMDVPSSTWTNINIGDAPNIIGPVSKVVFKEELQQLTDNYGANYLLQFSRFKRLALGDEERAVLEDWAEKVQVRPMVENKLLEFASNIKS